VQEGLLVNFVLSDALWASMSAIMEKGDLAHAALAAWALTSSLVVMILLHQAALHRKATFALLRETVRHMAESPTKRRP
jgi:hypothetical protein